MDTFEEWLECGGESSLERIAEETRPNRGTVVVYLAALRIVETETCFFFCGVVGLTRTGTENQSWCSDVSEINTRMKPLMDHF